MSRPSAITPAATAVLRTGTIPAVAASSHGAAPSEPTPAPEATGLGSQASPGRPPFARSDRDRHSSSGFAPFAAIARTVADFVGSLTHRSNSSAPAVQTGGRQTLPIPDDKPARPHPAPQSLLQARTTLTQDSVAIDLTQATESLTFVVGHSATNGVVGNEIHLTSGHVSPRHIEVRYTPGNRRLEVRDTGSRGGTLVGFGIQKLTPLTRDGLRVSVAQNVREVVIRLGGHVDVVLKLPYFPRPSSPGLPTAIAAPTAASVDARLSQPMQLGDDQRESQPVGEGLAPTNPGHPGAAVRKTAPDPKGPLALRRAAAVPQPVAVPEPRPTVPVSAALAASAVPTVLTEALRQLLTVIPNVQSVSASVHGDMVYATATSLSGNQVHIAFPTIGSAEVGAAIVQHLKPVLIAAQLPTQLHVSVKFEPDKSYELMCDQQKPTAEITKAMAGGLITIRRSHWDEPGAVMNVEILLPRLAAQDVAKIHQRLNTAKTQVIERLQAILEGGAAAFEGVF